MSFNRLPAALELLASIVLGPFADPRPDRVAIAG
jgi:hypothetical protein